MHAVGHRRLRVQREIQDHLLDLDGIPAHRRQPGAESQLRRDPRPGQVRVQETEHLADERIALVGSAGSTSQRAASALLTIAPSGWLISCASVAASSPTAVTRWA